MNKPLSGINEEIKVSNFFSKLNYFTRFHVQLYPRAGKISDIDVFCIKFDKHLCPTRNIIETKRGSESTSAIFQLHGLKSYFENCNAFFINKTINYRTFKITDRLNIKVYSYNRLNKILENDLNQNCIDLSLSDGEKIIKYLEIIKKIIDSELFWNYNLVWLEQNPFMKLVKLQEMFKQTEDLYLENEKNYALLWFRKELFILSFLSILEICSKCIQLNNNQINYYIEDQFYNLGSSKKAKMNLKNGVDSLLDIVEKKIDKKIDFKLDIIPSWVPFLSKVVKVLISNSRYANSYLLINDQILKAEIIGKPKNISYFCPELTKKILPSINSDILKILHKEHILSDFNNYV